MKIRQLLKEAAGVTAAFAFGRFNPAHQGHIAVWKTVQNAGVKWYIGTNPTTHGPNDPLTFDQKTAWMEAIYPAIAGHIEPANSVLFLAAKIYQDLGGNQDSTVAYITDETDWAWSGKLLNQYNGVEGAHGFYKFSQIVHVPSPRVSSATALRDAARADDKVAFYHASGTDPKLKIAGKTYFDTVREACLGADANKASKRKPKAESVEEASLATMRDYFAGNKNAEDELKITQIRKHYEKEIPPNSKIQKKEFRSHHDYDKWLEKNGLSKVGGNLKEVAPPGMEQWIKDRKSEFKKRYGDRWQEVLYATAWKQHNNESVEGIENQSSEELLEYLRKIHKRWALVSKGEGKPLVYYKGEGKPSKEWVKKQERRIGYFKHKK